MAKEQIIITVLLMVARREANATSSNSPGATDTKPFIFVREDEKKNPNSSEVPHNCPSGG